MSTWIEIKDQDDVEFCKAQRGVWKDTLLQDATIDVLYSNDDFGNNYVSIPVKFILKVLRDNGYEIT
jgi:hypothetical protein